MRLGGRSGTARSVVAVALLVAALAAVVLLALAPPVTALPAEWSLLPALILSTIFVRARRRDLVHAGARVAATVMQAVSPVAARLSVTAAERDAAAGAVLRALQLDPGPARALIGLAREADRDAVSQALDRMVAGTENGLVEHVFVLPRRGERRVGWFAYPGPGSDSSWRALVRDVTPDPRTPRGADHELRLLEDLNCAVIGTDREGKISSWSRAAERMLGYDAHQVLGKPMAGLVTPPEQRLVQRSLLRPLRPGGGALNLVSRFRHRYGGAVGVYLVATVRRGAQGELEGLACCLHPLDQLGEAGQVLDATGERYSSLVESAHDIIYTLGADGRLTSLNPAFETVTGWSRNDWLGRPFLDLVHPDDVVVAEERFGNMGEEGTPPPFVLRIKAHFGAWLTVEITAAPLLAEGAAGGAFGIVRDISERIRSEEALRESESRFRTLVEYAADPILVHDRAGRLLDVNHVACETLGYSREELLARTMADIDLHSGEEDWAWQGLEQGQAITLETEYRRSDGSSFPVEVRLVLIELAGEEHVLALSRDVTERKQAERRLDHLAHHDTLTGLPNRLLFRDRLDHALIKAQRSGTRLALCFLDLDRFKDVNDTLGHTMGDTVLQHTARWLREAVRQGDTVARFGGDEFVIILEEVNGADDACLVGRKILECFSQPMEVAGHRLLLGTSIGISLYPDHADDADSLLRKADSAMYRAKQQGTNRLYCLPDEAGPKRQRELDFHV